MSDEWTPVGNAEPKGQRSGRVSGRRRNSAAAFTAGHNNRAGHRLYARVNQPRQFRKNVLGMGRWRRGGRLSPDYETWAAQSAPTPLMTTRAERRAEWALTYRAARKARLRSR